jgi:hypothetical protein
LWKAGGPRSPEVAQGLFEVGSDAGFVREEVPLRGELPEGFYVSVFEKADGKGDDGRDGWIDLSRLDGASARGGRVHDPHGKGDDPGGHRRPADMRLTEAPVRA